MKKFMPLFMLIFVQISLLFGQLTTSNLPIIKIDVEQLDTWSDAYKIGNMQVIWNQDGLPNWVNATPNNYDGKIAIKVRGSSSRNFPKLQYRIETQDESGENLNVSLLGMPEENDWVLYAPYSDKTLMRNVLTYELGNRINKWAPRTRFCEVILNDDYVGIYVLMEKIKRDGDRVDIFKLLPEHDTFPEISGGYLFSMDRIDEDESFVELSSGLKFKINEPDEITDGQKNFLKFYLDDFEKALNGNGDYNDYIDAESFAINFLMVEFAKNIDGLRLSTFFHKDVEEKIVAGPLWDYNLSFGNADYLDGWKSAGWYYNLIWDNENYWFKTLYENYPDFQELCKNTWKRLRQTEINTPNLYAMIDDWVEELKVAQVRNFNRWPSLGTYVWPNPGYPQSESLGFKSGAPTTWMGEIDYMKNFIQNRINWLDEQFELEFADINLKIEMSNSGKIFYNSNYFTEDVKLGAIPQDIEIQLEAKANPGFKFKHWLESYTSDESIEIISKGSDWKYLDNGSFPGDDWYTKEYDDILWKNGYSEFGYGDGDENTVVSYGSNAQAKYITTYFRKKFTIDQLPTLQSLKVGLVADDGAIVYLNGTAIFRFNMPDGDVNNTTLATNFIADAQESVFNEYTISPGLLIEGENIIAVEIHQNNAGSSDISFNLELEGSLIVENLGMILSESEILNYFVDKDEIILTAVFESDGTVPPTVVINEINYQPSNGNDYEFVELTNITEETIDLSGFYFGGIEYIFPNNSEINPGEYFIITKDKSKFSDEIKSFDWFSGDLNDNGESLVLRNAAGERVDSVNYASSSPWPQLSDGKTLELIQQELDNSKAKNWQSSFFTGGTPGRSNIFPISNLFINEFLASNESGIVDENNDHEDWLELYNANDFAVNVGGLYVSDKEDNALYFQIADDSPELTTIEPKQFLLLWCDSDVDDGVLHVGMKLGKSGETISISQKIGDDVITIDKYSFGEQITDVSFGRSIDGGSEWTSFYLPTPGKSNSPTAIEDDEITPGSYKLCQNYPNPFNPETTIEYHLAKNTDVRLKIFNMLGQEVATLINNENQAAGYYHIKWNAADFSSGVYLILFEAGDFRGVKKVLLMK